MMIKYNLLESFIKNNINFFSGVPDSLLSHFSIELEARKLVGPAILVP